MYRLVFLNGRMKGRRVAVQQGSITIGRDPQCHIDISYDDEVSRNHATIEQRPDGVYLKDLGSINTTEVNGKKVGEIKLKHGDKLEIGKTQIEFQNIEVAQSGPKRSYNQAQILAFAAIAVVILIQLVFVFVLPLWQETEITPQPRDRAKKDTNAIAAAVQATKAVAETNTPTPTANLEAALSQIHAETNAAASAEAESSATTGAQQVSAEVQQLRQALAELQKQVADMNPQGTALAETNVPAVLEPTTSTVAAVTDVVAPVVTAAVEAAVEAPANPVDEHDALVEKAKTMLANAKDEMARSNYVAADDILERIQVLAPDFMAAYIERAKLYESRGMLKKSGEQWSKVMDLSMGSPMYEEAAAERQRLARTELMQSMTSERTDDKDNGQRLPRRIRLISVEREKFEANQEFDEMRLLRINVKPRMSEGEIDTGEFVCTVVFYDRSQAKDVVRPTRAVAPKDALKVDGKWPAGEQKTLTAAYIVPKNFRNEEEKTLGEKRNYEGYRVLIYYKGVLQDEAALPKTLLSLPAPPPPERTGK